MNLLFIHGGSRVSECRDGSFYVDGNFNNNIWRRYKSYCDKLTIVLRKKDDIFESNQLKSKLNKIDTSILDLKLIPDMYSPKCNYINFKIRKIIKKAISESVEKSDFIIIRSIGNFYTNTALKYCKKYKKKYLIEVTGFGFDSLWYHSFFGKIIAIPREIYMKKSIKKAPFALYVTEKALQNRYPCFGKTIGCSDVEISDKCTIKKVNILGNKDKIIIGTAAFLDVKWKGQTNVLKAICYLKKNGYDNIEYQMIGSGSGNYLRKMASKLNVLDNVQILGSLNHEDVFNWLKCLDIYIQPSYQEGLCRSIIEAMSVGCPVICSDVGGNFELIDKDFIYSKKSYKLLAKKIIALIESESLLNSTSKKNYMTSKKYVSSVLNKKRDKFYQTVIKGE